MAAAPGPERSPAAFYLARASSLVGDSAAAAALALLIYQRFGSTRALGAFFVVRAAPRLLGPLLGSLSDTRELRRLLRTCDAVSAVLYATVALVLPRLSVLLVFVAAAEVIAVISLPATRTAVTRLVPEDKLTNATVTVAAISGLSGSIGAAIGGLVAALVGARYGLALEAVSFLASAALTSTLPVMPPPAAADRVPPPPRRRGTRVLAGFPVLLGPGVRILPAVLAVIAFGAALDRSALVVLSEDVLTRGNDLVYGLAVGAVSIGVFASATLVRRRPGLIGYPGLVAALVVQGVAHAAAGRSPDPTVLVAVTFVIGFGNGLEVIIASRLLQQAIPRSALGAANGALLTVTTLLDAAGSAIGAALLATLSPRTVFAIAGGLMLLAVPPVTRTVRRETPVPTDQPPSAGRADGRDGRR